MTTKDIDVNGEVFPCPIEWTVDQAEARIKSFYSFQRGGLRENNVPLLGNVVIGSRTGTLVYVGGQPIQQPGARAGGGSTDYSRIYFPVFEPREATNKVGELMAAGRARLVTVFDPQHTHVPPRGVMFDEDFITASELSDRLTELREQHGAFVDTFARALSKMKDFEKAMLGEDDKCTLCDRTDLTGYQCITCNHWVCEFCFPQVMRAEVRTTLVVLPNGVNEIHLKCPYCRNLFNEAIGPTPRNSKGNKKSFHIA